MPETSLQLILQANVKKGQEKTLQNLAKTAPSVVEKNEPGTLDYRWVINDDGTGVRMLETYNTSQAFIEHINAAKQSGFLDQLMSCVDLTSTQVIGNPTPAAKEILDGLGASYFHTMAGFNRQQPVGTMTTSH